MMSESASRLTDSELTAQVARLARDERASTVALIVHLAEFDARRLFAAEGFSSTFSYCVEVLRLSEDATFNRIQAARFARDYPVVVDLLLEGALSPTTASMLARHVTAENHAALLAAASGKSKREVEKLLARLFPQAEKPDAVRAIRRPKDTPRQEQTAACLLPAPPAPAEIGGTLAAMQDPADVVPRPIPAAITGVVPGRAAMTRPISANRYEIRFTAGAETYERLRRAQDLLGHAIPNGDLGQVFDRALALLVADLERRVSGATARPRKGQAPVDGSRHIPEAVRRAVWNRDDARCAFVGSGGRRCDARRFLQFHHLKPYAVGGRATVDNIQLRCRAHNRYEADLFYGPLRREGSARLPVPERVTKPPVPERVYAEVRSCSSSP